MRHTLHPDMTAEEGVELMIEDHEPARIILTEIINKHVTPHFVLLDLDDMNIRGEQIPAGVKLCNGSIKRFVELVTERNLWLVQEINKECLKHSAVTAGASSTETRNY